MIDNLRLIRAFLVVARVGNFTRASMELRLSQSALTVQIKQLEDDLGVILFDRGKRHVSLTQAGADVILPLERLLIDAEEIVSRTQQLSGLRRGIVAVAALPSLATKLIPDAVRQFTALHPGIVVQIRDVVADKIIEAVKNEEVDFGIGGRPRTDRELKTTPLFVDRLSAFMPENHPLAEMEEVTLRELIMFPLILTGRDSSVRELVEAASKREALELSFAYETNYMSTAIGLVGAGMGVAILPDVNIDLESSKRIVKKSIRRPELSRHIDLIEKKDRSKSPAAQKMFKIIQNLALEPSSSDPATKPV